MFEHLLRNVLAQAALFVLGMPASTVAITLLVYAAFALHGHSNLRRRPLARVRLRHPAAPPLHHLPATTQTNFGTIFTIWDRLLGRLVTRDAQPDERTGVPGQIDDYPQHFLSAPVSRCGRRRPGCRCQPPPRPRTRLRRPRIGRFNNLRECADKR